MKTMTILNHKGGTGKTTLAAHIGGIAADRGLRVVLIDMDAQFNLSSWLTYSASDDLFQLLQAGASWRNVLVNVDPARYMTDPESTGSLRIVRGDANTKATEMALRRRSVLKQRLAELEGHADLAILDMSPSVSRLTEIALYASTHMLIPVRMEVDSIAGLEQVLLVKEDVEADSGEPVDLMGIVPVAANMGQVLDQMVMEELQNRHGDLVWDPIPKRTAWGGARLMGQLVTLTDPLRAGRDALALASRALEALDVKVA